MPITKKDYKKAWSEVRARKSPSNYDAFKKAMISLDEKYSVFSGWITIRENRFKYRRATKCL